MRPIIDFHCDTLSKLVKNPALFFSPQSKAHSQVTYAGLRSAGSLLQCFSLFTDLTEQTDSSPLSCVEAQYHCFRRILSQANGTLVQIRTFDDLVNARSGNKLAALLTLEESCLCKHPESLLPKLYALGVRIATLTWEYPNLLAAPAAQLPSTSLLSPLLRSYPRNTGLTPSGRRFVEAAEAFGILLDVSHLSDTGFYELASCTKRPFLASHSNSRSVCNVPRNLSDSMLRMLAERGGVVGLNLYEPFLLPHPATGRELLDALVRHVTHILSAAGTDTPVLGTDFDGIPGNRAIPDITCLPLLAHALKKAGVSSGTIDKLFYQNALRFLKENL